MSIDKYIDNNRITCNVYGKNDELLIGVGTPMSYNIRKRLEERKWYTEKPSDYIYDNIALLDDDLTPLVTEEVNTNVLIEKAKKVVELVLNNPIVFSNLKKIHVYDEYTYDHCNEVAYLAVAMGIRMKLNTHELINIAIAALTHDIGKCLIPKEIINKPGKLTDMEMDEVRLHPIHGYNIMSQSEDIDEEVAKIILYHHENHDGSGYPEKIKTDDIPLSSSIIHVCDVYDALTSERPYKKKIPVYDSVNILVSDSGTMFNPKAIEVFSSSLLIYGVGSIIELPTGEKVEITEIIKDEFNNVKQVYFKEVQTEKVFVRSLERNIS